MITNINKFKKFNENLLASIGSLNPAKKTVFTKSSFGPTFELLLYSELKAILPHGYRFDVNMWGSKNFLIINDVEGKQTKFSLGENTSVFKVKNMVKAKFNIVESVTVNENTIDPVAIWNEYIKLVDIIDGIISEHGELPIAYWKDGVETKMDEITKDYQISTPESITPVLSEIKQNFKDLYDGLTGWYMSGHDVSRYGNYNGIQPKLFESVNVPNRDDMMTLLSQQFPNIWLKKSEDFKRDDNNKGIWTGAEGSTFINAEKTIPAFNPIGSYSFNKSINKNYINEVHKTLYKFLNSHGWYAEFYDNATIFFYPIINSIKESATSGNYILEDVVTDFLEPYIKPDAEYNLDNDDNKVMIYIDADDVLFDIFDQHAPEWNIIKLGFDNFCKANNLYNGDATTTDDSLVLSAEVDIVDVRQVRQPQSNEFRR